MNAGVCLGNIAFVNTISILAIMIIPSFCFCISLTYWITSSSLISIWLTKFIIKCKGAVIESKNDTSKLVSKVKNILLIYANLDQTLGAYFVFCFTIFLLNWIIVLYLGVTGYFSKYEVQFSLTFGAGSLITATGGEYMINFILI